MIVSTWCNTFEGSIIVALLLCFTFRTAPILVKMLCVQRSGTTTATYCRNMCASSTYSRTLQWYRNLSAYRYEHGHCLFHRAVQSAGLSVQSCTTLNTRMQHCGLQWLSSESASSSYSNTMCMRTHHSAYHVTRCSSGKSAFFQYKTQYIWRINHCPNHSTLGGLRHAILNGCQWMPI